MEKRGKRETEREREREGEARLAAGAAWPASPKAPPVHRTATQASEHLIKTAFPLFFSIRESYSVKGFSNISLPPHPWHAWRLRLRLRMRLRRAKPVRFKILRF